MKFFSPPRLSLSLATPAVLCATIVFTGCKTVGDDYERPATQADAAENWNGRLEGAISRDQLDPEVLAQWWKTLEDDKLTSLINRAAEANLDLRTARAQLRQARAQRQIAEAAGKPQIGVNAGANRAGTGAASSSLYSVGLDASWELDLFGGIQRGVEAAEADLQAAEEARRDVLVTILAEVALNYTELRTRQQQRTLALANLKTQQANLEIVEAQLEFGQAGQLDVDRANANVETTKAQIPQLQQGIEESKNRLAVLLGKTPGALGSELKAAEALPVPPITVAVGVPAEVLRRRPDVRKAERELAAQTARVGVAIADLYPKFTLNGTIGLESPSTGSLFDSASQIFSIGPRAQWTIYSGGRIRAQIDVQDALQEQALIQYERTMLKALEEVQNAITAYTQEKIRYQSLLAASESATRAAETAETRGVFSSIHQVVSVRIPCFWLKNRDLFVFSGKLGV